MTRLVKLKTSKHGSIYLSEENDLDTYISREVLVPEGDEAKSLTQEELGQGQEDQALTIQRRSLKR